MDAVNEFIRFHNVQHDLAMRLRQTVEHKWHINQVRKAQCSVCLELGPASLSCL